MSRKFPWQSWRNLGRFITAGQSSDQAQPETPTAHPRADFRGHAHRRSRFLSSLFHSSTTLRKSDSVRAASSKTLQSLCTNFPLKPLLTGGRGFFFLVLQFGIIVSGCSSCSSSLSSSSVCSSASASSSVSSTDAPSDESSQSAKPSASISRAGFLYLLLGIFFLIGKIIIQQQFISHGSTDSFTSQKKYFSFFQKQFRFTPRISPISRVSNLGHKLHRLLVRRFAEKREDMEHGKATERHGWITANGTKHIISKTNNHARRMPMEQNKREQVYHPPHRRYHLQGQVVFNESGGETMEDKFYGLYAMIWLQVTEPVV